MHENEYANHFLEDGVLDGIATWVQCRPLVEPMRMRLFCLPHAGGGASTFRSWSSALAPSIQVCPILLPGRESRYSEAAYTQLDSLVDTISARLRPSLDLPYAVFGHSMGAMLAFEWVRRLQSEGAPMPAWLFLSGRRAPHLQIDTPLLHPLPDDEFVKELTLRYQGIPQQFLEDPELLEVFLPVLRADLAVVESYSFRESEPLACPITVFGGNNDTSVSWQQLLAWKRHTSSQFAIQLLPGAHFYPHPPLLQSLASTLAAVLGPHQP